MAEQTVSGDTHDVAAQLREILDKATLFNKDRDFPATVHADWTDTPFGAVLLVGDDKHLYFLNFIDDDATMVRRVVHTQKILKSKIEVGNSTAIAQAKHELDEYFAGKRKTFETPVSLVGTSFQVTAWEAIKHTPFGETLTYAELAQNIDRPSSFRAVAQACSQNPVAIVVPCHRIINSGDTLGGYSGGNERKAQLLDFEKKTLQNNR